ncbi:uncharacterized protein LOC119728921 [Patiria miniata]|uniref:Essential protein Yae1 N-terminal domain-containing protein n=1 Tax=Patiria miniata TaxID=46514 RepID=A0A914A087_PATMI|nr:uncharacterized protein LOC119728921 [Patiria miniata]XP_038057291.1 uncharacterized protein LOC119728921 [Patiria miniata]XP_038057292.1 uncharacterized protein LOC119728921 [Patiria miniata]XP_038057293.1 uncharacterized protein LOC119728921 [Patiria miniata]
MASTQEVDCFHDNTEEEEEDNFVVDVEWSKLKASHMKEGYRDGYSAGQEAVLQDAFNRGFAHHVQLETSASFYKGILWALKTFAERSRTSKTPPTLSLSASDESRIASLLEELRIISGGNDSTSENTNSTDVDEEDKTDAVSENCLSQNPEGSIVSDQASHCNPAGCVCLSADSDGEASHGGTSKPKSLNEGTFEYGGQHSNKMKEVAGNCKDLLKELGLEKMLHLLPSKRCLLK